MNFAGQDGSVRGYRTQRGAQVPNDFEWLRSGSDGKAFNVDSSNANQPFSKRQ